MKHIYIRKNRLFYTKILFILSVFCVSSIFSEATLYLGKEGISNFVPTIQDQDFTVEEGSPSGSEVGTIAATSNDTGLTFTLVNATFVKEGNPPEGDSEQDPAYDAMAVFNLDQASGALTIANPKYLLAVLGPVVLAIDVTDSSGEVASAIITVNISDMEVDIVENTNLNWTTVANHPQGHSEATGGAIGQNLYVFGGFTSNFAPKASVFALNTEGDSWSRLADMPPMASNSGGGGATHMGFTDDGTDIYIAAGYAADASGNAQQFGARRVYKYIVAEDRYDELPSLPIDRSAGALEYVANKLYYMAGTNRSRDEDQGDLLVLDLDDLNSGWSYLSAMPNPRNHIGTAVFDGQIHVFGGQKEHDEALVPQDDVHRYD
ncbi:MAG: kelch repeat-containing protein, partial [Leeuwenhoekiella sp.]